MPGLDVEVYQLLKDLRRRQVLEARERRLARQRLIVREPISDQLEDRIIAQRVVIVAIFIASENAE